MTPKRFAVHNGNVLVHGIGAQASHIRLRGQLHPKHKAAVGTGKPNIGREMFDVAFLRLLVTTMNCNRLYYLSASNPINKPSNYENRFTICL
jgi:hypothetical protein